MALYIKNTVTTAIEININSFILFNIINKFNHNDAYMSSQKLQYFYLQYNASYRTFFCYDHRVATIKAHKFQEVHQLDQLSN